jgi:hypothetical protein
MVELAEGDMRTLQKLDAVLAAIDPPNSWALPPRVSSAKSYPVTTPPTSRSTCGDAEPLSPITPPSSGTSDSTHRQQPRSPIGTFAIPSLYRSADDGVSGGPTGISTRPDQRVRYAMDSIFRSVATFDPKVARSRLARPTTNSQFRCHVTWDFEK